MKDVVAAQATVEKSISTQPLRTTTAVFVAEPQRLHHLMIIAVCVVRITTTPSLHAMTTNWRTAMSTKNIQLCDQP